MLASPISAIGCARAPLALALCLAAAGARAEPPSRLRIELPAVVEVGPGAIRLGDVARVQGNEADRLRLEALPLGRAPQAGQSTRLERRALARWVRARTGLDATRVAWSGAPTCEVRLAVRTLSGSELVRRAEEGVRGELGRRGLQSRVTALATPADLLVAGEPEIRLRSLAPDAALARRLSVWLDVAVGGAHLQTVPVTLELATRGAAPLARQALAAGAPLDGSQLVEGEVEWSGLPAMPLERSAVSGGLRLRAPVEAGEVLTRAQVEPAPLVTRGGTATLHVSQGLVALVGMVEVLEDGFSGQSVHVRVRGGEGPVLARVTGVGTVELSP